MAKLNDLIVTGDAKFLGKLHANADTATTASSVFDAGDNSILTLNRSATALSNPTYLAGWDGNVLKAVNRSNLSVNYATSSGAISALTENDKASSSDTQRRVWFAYSNNTTGRPAYDEAFTYQTSTGTLTAKIFKGALSGTSDRSKYLETWKADKSQGTYGTQYPLHAWWESSNVCKLVVDGYSTKVDTANTAAALTSNAGSSGQAIYFANGVPVALDWRIGNKDVGEHNCDNVTYNFSGYYTSKGPATTLGASTGDGALWSQAHSSSWVAQIAQDYRNGNLFVRGKNNGTWQSWKAVLTSPNKPMVFHWSGQNGQPTWLWGGTDGTNMYVYNPSNFSVNYANSAGGAPWSGITDKPSTYPPSAHTHSYITYQDTRDEDVAPKDLSPGVSIHLKTKAIDGLNEGGSYHPVLALKPWGDHSGGPYGQLTTTSTGSLYYRHSTSETAWSGWYNVAVQNKDNAFVGDNTFTGIIKILSTNDAGVGSESGALRIGTMTGNHLSLDDNEIMAKSNASTASTLYLNNEGGLVQVGPGGLSTSGTITAPTFAGNATTASSTPMLSCSNSSAADSVDDVLTSSASLRLHKASAAMYNNNDGLVLTASWSGSYGAQLWLDDGGGEGGMAIRNRKSDGWNPWRQILSSGNFNSYAPKLDGTGASGTWGINITGNATTANSATYASSAGDIYTSSVSGDTHAVALKNWFDTHKNSTVRNHLLSFYSSAYGNGSQYMGYFLSGYNDTPYGGFFVAHYTTPYYVGIQNGTYTQWELSKAGHTHSYLPLAGGTMTGTIDMNNNKISNIGDLAFADPGANEGITWTGGNGWAIYESPDNLSNDKGNLQFVQGTTRRLTINKDGYVDVNCRMVVRGNGSSYNEGIRILPASNGWSNVFFSANTTLSDTHDGGWLIGRRGAAGTVGAVGDFTIEEQNSNGSNLTIHKDSGGATLKGRFSADGGSFGYNNTSYTLSTASFICNSWISTNNATGWRNETYGGGMYMADTTYVRVYNDKQFYVSNSGQHAIYTAGGFASAKTSGPVLSTYYNNTWYDDTIQTHGNGNLSISAPGGNLYLAYSRGVTYFGGGTYCIDRSGYFNGTSAVAHCLPTSITFADASSPWTPATIYSSIGSGGRIKKGSWDYAGNGYVAKGNVTNGSKCPFFAIDLAGTTVIQAANSSSVYTQIYITSPTTSGVTGAATNEMVFYNYHGDDYSPAWTRVLTNRNYNAYAPTLTGTGASGTWGISITGNAATATLPLGFTSRNDNATWGNQTGTTVTCWNEANGGSVDWRRDNPSSGKISLKVDGRFYGNEGNNPAMLLTTDGSYWGMGSPDGDASVWIRTTSQGIIPYAAKSAGSGTCYLGTSSWYFGYAYIDHIYGSSFSGNAATATKATKDGNGNTISSTYLKLSGGTMTGNITLGSYGMLGFGNTIPATHKEVTSFTPEDNAVWLATTGGGGESAGICLDGAAIRFWTPNDSAIEFLDSDTAAGTTYASVKFGTVTGGTWNGSTIGVAYGGTGRTSWITNRAIYASTATTLSVTSHYVSATKMAINSTSAPSQNFYVSGSSYFSGAVTITGTLTLTKTTDASATANNSPALIIGGAATAAHIEIDNNEIIAKSNGTTQTILYIQDTGGVTEFGGQVKAPSFNATSDMRLKTNLRAFKHGDIFDLPIYKFDFIAGETNKIGCMAQDLQQICPEIVHQGEDGYLSIEESKIVYLLLDKMKEMQKEIDILKEAHKNG